MNKKFNTHADLIDFLKEASMAYYTGEPFISDVEFDSLAKMADYKEVGSTSIDNRISHLSRMYSLQKVFENEHADKNPLSDYKGKLVLLDHKKYTNERDLYIAIWKIKYNIDIAKTTDINNILDYVDGEKMFV